MKLRNALLVSLALQLVLVLVVWWPADPEASRPRPLIPYAAESIDSIRIESRADEGETPESLHLVRDEAGWRIESAAGYPADPDKVESLIDDLLEIKVRGPIAVQRSSHNQLGVGEAEYGKRIRVGAAGDELPLVIGAAGNKRSHVRRDGADEVYLVPGLSEWSLRGDSASYYDPVFVHFDPAEVTSFDVQNELGRWDFVRDDSGTWLVSQADAPRSVDAESLESLLTGLAGLRISEPVGVESKPEYGLDPGVRIAWTLRAEEESRGGGFTLGRSDGGQAYVRSSESRYIVKVPDESLAPLRTLRASDFGARSPESGELQVGSPAGELAPGLETGRQQAP